MSPIAISPQASYCHCNVILIMTSFATDLATPSFTDVRYVRTDTLPRLIYKDGMDYGMETNIGQIHVPQNVVLKNEN